MTNNNLNLPKENIPKVEEIRYLETWLTNLNFHNSTKKAKVVEHLI